jgi:TolB-like protein
MTPPPDLQKSLSQAGMTSAYSSSRFKYSLEPFFPRGALSGDPDQEYFVDGTTDELITDLAQKCMPTG